MADAPDDGSGCQTLAVVEGELQTSRISSALLSAVIRGQEFLSLVPVVHVFLGQIIPLVVPVEGVIVDQLFEHVAVQEQRVSALYFRSSG
jgi:hypothetical protein